MTPLKKMVIASVVGLSCVAAGSAIWFKPWQTNERAFGEAYFKMNRAQVEASIGDYLDASFDPTKRSAFCPDAYLGLQNAPGSKFEIIQKHAYAHIFDQNTPVGFAFEHDRLVCVATSFLVGSFKDREDVVRNIRASLSSDYHLIAEQPDPYLHTFIWQKDDVQFQLTYDEIASAQDPSYRVQTEKLYLPILKEFTEKKTDLSKTAF